jgi:hypothetical protein
MRQLEVQWPTVLLCLEGVRKVTTELNRHYQSEAEVSSRILRHTSHRTTLLMSGRSVTPYNFVTHGQTFMSISNLKYSVDKRYFSAGFPPPPK